MTSVFDTLFESVSRWFAEDQKGAVFKLLDDLRSEDSDLIKLWHTFVAIGVALVGDLFDEIQLVCTLICAAGTPNDAVIRLKDRLFEGVGVWTNLNL